MSIVTEKTLRDALRKAYNFGQTYFSQADSESRAAHKRADETAQKFEQFIEDTCAALAQHTTAAGSVGSIGDDPEFSALLTVFGNLNFDAGAWDEDDEKKDLTSYRAIVEKGREARAALVAYIDAHSGKVEAEGLTEGHIADAGQYLPLMMRAFVTSESDGKRYSLRFGFRSMDEMHRASDEWFKYCETISTLPKSADNAGTAHVPTIPDEKQHSRFEDEGDRGWVDGWNACREEVIAHKEPK